MDNPGTTCGPCDRAARYASAGRTPRPTTPIGLRELAETWADGFPAFQKAAGLDETDAARLAESLGLIPSRWLLTADQLAEMARRRTAPTSSLADRWQVSRWTVATWRQTLGLERIHATTPADEAPPVEGVHIVRGERTRIVGPDGPVRLGRSARGFLDAIVDAYPGVALAPDLCHRLFPDAASEQARAALHATVSRLRRHLPDGTIRRKGGGYTLAVHSDAIVDADAT